MPTNSCGRRGLSEHVGRYVEGAHLGEEKDKRANQTYGLPHNAELQTK